MGYNLHTIDLGCRYIPGIHDRDIRTQKGLHYLLVGDATSYWDYPVVVVHYQDLHPAEQARQLELRIRGGERGGNC